MSLSQSNRDSLCSTADSDCSALSAASDSVAVQLRRTHCPTRAHEPSSHRHSITSVERHERHERDAFLFQPIAAASHSLIETTADTASESDIPQHTMQSATSADCNSRVQPEPSASVGNACANSSTSTPFSGYYSASSSISLPSLVGAASAHLPVHVQLAPQCAQAPAPPASCSTVITPSHSAELDSMMTASVSSAPHAHAHAHAHAYAASPLSLAIAIGTSASADVLLIRPTPIKLAAQAHSHAHDSQSAQSLAHAHAGNVPVGGAFTQVTTTLVYERELCSLMQRAALNQLSNNSRLPQSGRAIARVRRSRTPSQPTNVSPQRCSSQPSDAQPAPTSISMSAAPVSSGCICMRGVGGASVIEFADGACGACAIAAARAASRKRRWRRRPTENSSSVEFEHGSFSDASQLASAAASQAETDSPPSDYDDRDELDVVSNTSVTDSPARCDSKCRRRFVASGTGLSRPSINAEKMLTVASLSDLHVQDSPAAAEAARSARCSVETDAQPTRRERERSGRHGHAHRRPVSQIFELRRITPFSMDAASGLAPILPHPAAVSTGVHSSFSMMENQLSAVCAATECDPPRFGFGFGFGTPVTPTQQFAGSANSGDEQSDSPNSDDEELLEAAAACVGMNVTTTNRFGSATDGDARAYSGESAILELDIEQIENN